MAYDMGRAHHWCVGGLRPKKLWVFSPLFDVLVSLIGAWPWWDQKKRRWRGGTHLSPPSCPRSAVGGRAPQPTRLQQHARGPAASTGHHHPPPPNNPRRPLFFLLLPNLASTRGEISEAEESKGERDRERDAERREEEGGAMMRCAAAAAVAVAVALAAVAGSAVAAESRGPAGTCARRDAPPFLDAVGSRCPFVRIEPSPPLEVCPLSSSHRPPNLAARPPLAATFLSKSLHRQHGN